MKKAKYKRKKRRYSQVIRRIRKNTRKQVEKEFYLMSKYDIDNKCLFVPPLKVTDTLFKDQGITTLDEQESHDTQSQLEHDEIYYQNGYASAAALMLNLIKNSSNRYVRESYINPAMFCFRQFLELSMKDSILRYRHMRKEGNKSEANIEGHNLVKLWEGLKLYLSDSDEEIQSIDNLVKEFQEVDTGTAFRYNRYLQHQNGEKEKCAKIDSDTLYTRMLQMYRFFEGVNEHAIITQEEQF